MVLESTLVHDEGRLPQDYLSLFFTPEPTDPAARTEHQRQLFEREQALRQELLRKFGGEFPSQFQRSNRESATILENLRLLRHGTTPQDAERIVEHLQLVGFYMGKNQLRPEDYSPQVYRVLKQSGSLDFPRELRDPSYSQVVMGFCKGVLANGVRLAGPSYPL